MTKKDDEKTQEVTVLEGKTAAEQKRAAELADEAAALKLDETIPGGKYLKADGKTLVNADGQEIDADGKVKGPAEVVVP